MKQRPFQLLRVSGIAFCALSTAFALAEFRFRIPGSRQMGSLLEVGLTQAGLPGLAPSVSLLAIAGIAVAFWLASRDLELFRSAPRAAFLLGIQSILALLTANELLLLVGAELPFVLSGRAAWTWLGIQSALQISSYYLHASLTGSHPLLQVLNAGPKDQWIVLAIISATIAILHLLAFGLGTLAATESRHARELAMRNAELRAFQQIQADTVRLSERLSLSRELHDAAGHHLAALSVNLRLLRKLAEPAEREERLQESLSLVHNLLTDVRAVVRDLREVASIDLRTVLATMANDIPGLTIHLTTHASLAEAEPYQAHALFRCAQEVITNTVKHAAARNLWLTLDSTAEGFRMDARDDGQGVGHIVWGNGLSGLRERVSEFGGSIEIHSRKGEGFRIGLVMPVRGKAA